MIANAITTRISSRYFFKKFHNFYINVYNLKAKIAQIGDKTKNIAKIYIFFVEKVVLGQK